MRYFLLFLLFASPLSFSQDYYWQLGTTEHGVFKGSSPAAVCRSFASNRGYTYDGGFELNSTSEAAICYFLDQRGYWLPFNVYRVGDGCSTTYNPSTGECPAPVQPNGEKCSTEPESTGLYKIKNSSGECVSFQDADKASQCKYLGDTGYSPTKSVWVKFDDEGQPSSADIQDKIGCELKPTLGIGHCKLPPARSSGGITIIRSYAKCNVQVSWTGNVAKNGPDSVPIGDSSSGKEGVCDEPSKCLTQDEPIVKDSKPCNYMYNGQVVGCESVAFEGNPGEMNCGTVNNGPYTCTKKDPNSKATVVKETIETKSNTDGTTTTTKKQEITQVTCAKAGSCVTNVTNNKSTTIKNSDGKVVSSTGECTGKACSSGSTGDSDGDGVKDCVIAKNCSDEGEEGGPALTSLTKPTKTGDFQDANSEWDEKIETTRQDLAQRAEEFGKLFQPLASMNLDTGSAELGCGEAFETIGGQTASICFGKYESQLSLIAAAVLFICALIALFIVFKPD
ncbi:hypothetical protein GO594_11990 [Pseudomonas otitidis]|uniref:Attachment protein n=1 Tax=Metapseudomonas otitidis TaxID=319939 RepID=A0A7X3KV70_9GAMM|nr:hypothetical protein [Pseudomonas otitidis]MWK56688.1 hypothetical protein [Pseudomonas otitidis]MWK56699.1 hypothetical protein [Pseudomonas otitidis]